MFGQNYAYHQYHSWVLIDSHEIFAVIELVLDFNLQETLIGIMTIIKSISQEKLMVGIKK